MGYFSLVLSCTGSFAWETNTYLARTNCRSVVSKPFCVFVAVLSQRAENCGSLCCLLKHSLNEIRPNGSRIFWVANANGSSVSVTGRIICLRSFFLWWRRVFSFTHVLYEVTSKYKIKGLKGLPLIISSRCCCATVPSQMANRESYKFETSQR